MFVCVLVTVPGHLTFMHDEEWDWACIFTLRWPRCLYFFKLKQRWTISVWKLALEPQRQELEAPSGSRHEPADQRRVWRVGPHESGAFYEQGGFKRNDKKFYSWWRGSISLNIWRIKPWMTGCATDNASLRLPSE